MTKLVVAIGPKRLHNFRRELHLYQADDPCTSRTFSDRIRSVWTKLADFCPVTQVAETTIAEENVELVRQKPGVLPRKCDFLDFEHKSQPLAA
jgi:hypothetical protein